MEAEAPATPQPEPPAPPPKPPDKPAAPAGDAPRAVLQRYYDHLERGDYGAAWRLRDQSATAGGLSADEFERGFASYAEYRATAGPASEPVEADGALFVEVPVQIYGRTKAGETFSTAGTVTLKKPAGGEWRIHTRD